MAKRKILITGAAGFIGYHLCQELLQDESNDLVLVDNFSRGKRDPDLEAILKRPNVKIISADLTDSSVYDQFGKGYDEVYHLAAILGVQNVLERPKDVLKVNLLTTLNLLEWFTQGGGQKILFSSSSECYAWTQQFYPLPIPTPEDVPLSLTDLTNPRSTYAGSKIFGELLVTQYCLTAEKPFVLVRYHNVYGPRMGYDHVIPQMYNRAHREDGDFVVYSASHRRAFCYVTDAVSATIQAMHNETADNQTFNIGNDLESITIGELATRLLKKVDVERALKPQEAANDPIANRCPDISKARELLRYEPQINLDQGLDMTIEWYRQWL